MADVKVAFLAQPASRPSEAPFAAQLASRPPINPATDSPLTVDVNGTVSCKMDQVGNNVMVTFSSNNKIALWKAKIFGSSAKMDTFTGQDMNQFPQWVAQFLSGVNLYQPTEPNACRFALHLLRGKAAGIAKNIPKQVSMNNLQELLTGLDKLFNTMGNRVVDVNIFNSYSQREDVSIQNYSIGIEQLLCRSYPGVDPNQSIFLMDRFISGLVSHQIKEKLRIPLNQLQGHGKQHYGIHCRYLVNIFFPSSPNYLKLLQYFFDLYRKVCGNF